MAHACAASLSILFTLERGAGPATIRGDSTTRSRPLISLRVVRGIRSCRRVKRSKRWPRACAIADPTPAGPSSRVGSVSACDGSRSSTSAHWGHQPMANEDGQIQVAYNGEISIFGAEKAVDPGGTHLPQRHGHRKVAGDGTSTSAPSSSPAPRGNVSRSSCWTGARAGLTLVRGPFVSSRCICAGDQDSCRSPRRSEPSLMTGWGVRP